MNFRNPLFSAWVQLALRVGLFSLIKAMMVKVKARLDYVSLGQVTLGWVMLNLVLNIRNELKT